MFVSASLKQKVWGIRATFTLSRKYNEIPSYRRHYSLLKFETEDDFEYFLMFLKESWMYCNVFGSDVSLHDSD